MNIWQTNGDMQQTIIDDSEINEPETEREEATDITKAERANSTSTSTIDNVADNVERARMLSRIAELLRSYEYELQTISIADRKEQLSCIDTLLHRYEDKLQASDNVSVATDSQIEAQPEQTPQKRLNVAARCCKRIGNGIRTMWAKRPKLSYVLYAVVFITITATSVLFLQWSVYSEPVYSDEAEVDDVTRAINGIIGQLTRFVCQMWIEQKMTFLLNFLVLGLAYLALLFIINRFWITTAVFGTVMVVFSVANKFKVSLRNEPIIPADLSFISGGNTGEILSFIPSDGQNLVQMAINGLAIFVISCLILQLLDRRNGVISCKWRPSRFLTATNITAVLARIVAAATSVILLVSFVWNLSVSHSWAQEWAQSLSDTPQLWDSLSDSRNNGPAMTFLRLAHAKTMDKPEDYSKETMEELNERYSNAASEINATRTANLSDNTVIMVLSETFADPTRVPDVSFGIDPIPNIRTIKNNTTSGIMLSPGYGGGTANIEFQALTGMTLANFDSSLQVPYQQLLPHMEQVYSFNQIWNKAYGEDGSVAFHPYYKNLYLRDSNYKKFGFSHLYTLDSDPEIEHQDRLDNSPNVSDAAAYQNVLDSINSVDHPQFIQLVTMQNHMPYNDYYADNEFKAADTSPLPDGERWQIENYAKGVSLTDQATAGFLTQLDHIDEPITVIFYGDHLPSIYTTADSNEANSTILHETDYFIWSNAASVSHNAKLAPESADYTSSNYFMASAAEHMNALVSPFLALLTIAHEQVPAISRIIAQAGGIGDGTASSTCLDKQGNTVDIDSLSPEAKQILHDYRLVQYDLSAGKGYLWQTDFFDVEQSEHPPLTRRQVPEIQDAVIQTWEYWF